MKIGTPQLVGRIRQKIPLIQIGGLPAQCPELLRVGGLQRPAGQILKDIHVQPCIGPGNPAVQAVFVANHALGVGKAQCSHGVACPAGVILQSAGGIAAAAVGPQKVDEFLSGDAPIPVQDQVGHQRPQPPGTAGETDHPGLLHAGLLQGKPPQHRGPDVCDLSHNQPPLWGCGALSRPHAAIISWRNKGGSASVLVHRWDYHYITIQTACHAKILGLVRWDA